MSATAAGILQLLFLVALLALAYRPLGDYMARVFTGSKHLGVERVFYRVVRIDPDADQRWSTYLLSLLGLSMVSVLFLFRFQRLQGFLPLSLGFPGVPPAGAFNTAVSVVTNTNWQWYSGEATMGHLVQMAGLAVQNFVSAAVGLAVAVALIRGLVRTQTDRLGNFWVDITRATVRVQLPLSCVFALVLVIGGAV
jgi:potassium-transporting ATPase potassium-binding subunit